MTLQTPIACILDSADLKPVTSIAPGELLSLFGAFSSGSPTTPPPGQVPSSLDEALDALEADHDFLKAGGVFTDDLIETWIEYKRINEVDAIRLRPHPWEFMLYYDI